MRKTEKNKLIIFLTAALFIGVIAAVCSVSAFQSTQVEYVTMEVTVGGDPNGETLDGFQISHRRLIRISPVTKMAIISGRAGTNMTVLNSKNVQAKDVQASDAGGVTIGVLVKYQFMDSTLPPDPTQFNTFTAFYNSDPTVFRFQIDPAQVTDGVLYYQILSSETVNGVVVSSASFPPGALLNPTIWAMANVQAGDAPLIGEEGGQLVIPDGNPDDGESSINVPAGLFHAPTSITLDEMSVNSVLVPRSNGLQPVAVYHLVTQPFSGGIQVQVIYPDFIPNGFSWVPTGTAVQKNTLSLAGWDGFSWRRLGGKIDTSANTITARVNYFSYLGVMPMAAASAVDYRPAEKIITPNGDTNNDSAHFYGLTADDTVKLFDVSGHEIRTISGMPNPQWDGRDDSGKIVESGVYIYQYTMDGQRVSGVIAVAK